MPGFQRAIDRPWHADCGWSGTGSWNPERHSGEQKVIPEYRIAFPEGKKVIPKNK
jgi:hypothetical protein